MALSSSLNRPYAPGSLAAQPVRTITQPMTSSRRLEQLSRRLYAQGDAAGSAQALAMSERLQTAPWVPGRGAPPSMPASMPPSPPTAPMPAPMAPPVPGGKLVPGRSAGSMVWQADAPPSLPAPGDLMPNLAPAPQRLPLPPDTAPPPMPMPEPLNPLQFDPLGNYVNPQPMTPPGFGAMNNALARGPGLPQPPPGLYGAEAPPPVDVARLPGTDYVAPIFNGKMKAQTLPMKQPDAPLPPGMVPTEANRGGITYRPKPMDTAKIPEGIQYEKDDMGRIVGGVYPAYNDQGKLVMRRIDMDGNGVVSPAELSAAQAAGQTPDGVKFLRVK